MSEARPAKADEEEEKSKRRPGMKICKPPTPQISFLT